MKTFYLSLSFLFLSISVFSQEPNWQVIDNPSFPATDVGVATYNVKEHGAKADGVTNDAIVFQTLLTQLGNIGGGVLYVPEGIYLIENRLVIPKGVTIRGDWQKPETGSGEPSAVKGTILKTAFSEGINVASFAFITMQPSSAVMNLSIWYYKQDPNNIKVYPPTILFGQTGFFGNDCCNVRNVTLVNSYIGIMTNNAAGIGASYNIRNLYGTPLYRGVDIDRVADVCKFDFIHFSPDYWAASGLENAPQKGSNYAKWIYNNGTAIEVRRNDWSYICFVKIDGYNKGFHGLPSRYLFNPDNPNYYPSPNGHNYQFDIRNCKNAIYIDGVANEGIQFGRIHISNCENGIVINPNTVSSESEPVMMLGNSYIDATEYAVLINEGSITKLLTHQCTIKNGKVKINGGTYTAVDCDFMNAAPQVDISSKARFSLTGNRFSETAEANRIDNKSLFDYIIDHTPLVLNKQPDFPDVSDNAGPITKPAKNTLYVVTNAPYNAIPFNSDGQINNPQAMQTALDAAADATAAIQQALDDAGANGGGIVYLPRGNYKILGRLIVPEGVELKGATDVASVPMGKGSILEIFADKNNPEGTPFIQLKTKSGIRGITLNYPEQTVDLFQNDNVSKYPYAVQGQGDDIYIVNLSVRATDRGIDLFTYTCNNYLVDYFAGHVLREGIRVGGGSSNGRIYNTQFNPISYANGYESKFGFFPNSPANSAELALVRKYIYDYCWNNLDFIILGDCKNQILYNDFIYGTFRGVLFKNEGKGPSGISLGLGIDAGVDGAIHYEAIDMENGGFDLINSQLVAVKEGLQSNRDASAFITTSPSFTGESTIYSSAYWGSANYGVSMANNGKINLELAFFRDPGQAQFIKLGGNDSVNVVNSMIDNRNRRKTADQADAQRISIQSSIIDLNQVTAANFKLWKNNLSNTPTFTVNDNVMLPREGWTAHALTNNDRAARAIDNDRTTVWGISSQSRGEWLYVDMKTEQEINLIILDNTNSNQYPREFSVYTSNQVNDFGEPVWDNEAVLAGIRGIAMTNIIQIPTTKARFVKIELTTATSAQWSIAEFYIGYDPSLTTGGLNDVSAEESYQPKIYAFNKTLFIDPILSNEKYEISIYTISGQRVFSAITNENTIQTDVDKGIYIVSIRQNGNRYTAKLLME